MTILDPNRELKERIAAMEKRLANGMCCAECKRNLQRSLNALRGVLRSKLSV